MELNTSPSADLRSGRRALEGINGVEILNDLKWYVNYQMWALQLRLTIDIPSSEFLSHTTDWYVLISSLYPWGRILIYPAKENSTNHTFHHQLFNGLGDESKPWRNGELCVSTSMRTAKRRNMDIEPYDPNERLLWHIKRTLEWLKNASNGTLRRLGEPYEIPDYPVSLQNNKKIVFNEGLDSFKKWNKIIGNVGLVKLSNSGLGQHFVFIDSFFDTKRRELIYLDWGNTIRNLHGTESIGIWILLEGAPVLVPWQAPTTWGELRIAFQTQNVNLNRLLQSITNLIRDGQSHVALIGYPIPENYGEVNIQIQWQAMMLPVLSHGNHVPKGFRRNETGYWQNDRISILSKNETLIWLDSENWHDSELTSRGGLMGAQKELRIAIIGAGAFGSIFAEMLAREGLHLITIIDGDRLEAQNLVRHNLLLSDVGFYKAERLAFRLNLVSPNAKIKSIPESFPPSKEENQEQIRRASVIIDCTGSDEALIQMEKFSWNEEKTFISFSLGIQAKRLYCFTIKGTAFPFERFRTNIMPWLDRELRENEGNQLPREGVGCWHPVFPARIDRIYMMAAASVELMNQIIRNNCSDPELIVFEYQENGKGFTGINRVIC